MNKDNYVYDAECKPNPSTGIMEMHVYNLRKINTKEIVKEKKKETLVKDEFFKEIEANSVELDID